MTMMMVL